VGLGFNYLLFSLSLVERN